MSRQDIRTVTLSGAEQCVEGMGGQNTTIRNDGSSTIYVSADPNIKPDADGVLAIFAGGVATYPGTNGTVYLLGTGKAQLCGTDYIDNVFTPIAAGGSSGGSGGGSDNSGGSGITKDDIDGLFGEGTGGGGSSGGGSSGITKGDIDGLF